MGLLKKLLASPGARSLIRPVMRGWRRLQFDNSSIRHDAALLKLLRSDQPVVFAVWHQDFLHTCGYLSCWTRRRPTRVLASPSRDGALMAEAAAAVGFLEAVRGSTSKSGAMALRGLTRAASTGASSVLVVCDGPRPPARVLKPGVLHVAKESGLPIWLVRTSWRPAKVFERSWARFVLPSLLARGVVLADGPFPVASDLDRAGLENLRVVLEARLNDLADRADALVAAP